MRNLKQYFHRIQTSLRENAECVTSYEGNCTLTGTVLSLLKKVLLLFLRSSRLGLWELTLVYLTWDVVVATLRRPLEEENVCPWLRNEWEERRGRPPLQGENHLRKAEAVSPRGVKCCIKKRFSKVKRGTFVTLVKKIRRDWFVILTLTGLWYFHIKKVSK